MASLDEKDQMKGYLSKQLKETEKELAVYKRKADKLKAEKMAQMEEEKQRKLRELAERQSRLVDLDENQKRDELNQMDRLKRQREELMAKKLADQQRELLQDLNQKDVDNLLGKHKDELKVMDEVLQDEQQRQIEKMRERMKNRGSNKAKEQAVRQIKLAEIQQAKQQELIKARNYEAAGGDLTTSLQLEKQKEAINRCIEKAALMQRLCQKQCYSRKIFFKRHLVNQQKLNSFLGRGILADWEESKQAPEDEDNMSILSFTTQDLMNQVNLAEEKITYKKLLEHIQTAESNLEAIKK